MDRQLTQREQELYACLMDSALRGKDIAAQMGLTLGSLRIYEARLYRELGAAGPRYGRIELLHREIQRLRSLLADGAGRHA